MTLIGLHVTQYMYVLFDKVHIYSQKSLFTLARCFASKTSGESADPRQFTEILIINVDENTTVMHGIKDILLLNATAVSDFKKLQKAHHGII